MPRPRTPAGSWGTIHILKLTAEDVTPEKWRARARYRTDFGKVILVERTASSETKATTALRKALAGMAATTPDDDKTMKVRTLAEMFLQSKAGKTANTVATYRYSVEQIIIPRIGDLAIVDATTARLQRVLDHIVAHHGAGTARTARKVLSGMFALAVQSGTLTRNPVRDLRSVEGKSSGATAIPLGDLADILERVRGDARLIELDMVNLLEFAASTGARISEIIALAWGSVDLDAGTVTIEANAVRVKGKGVIRQPHTKSDAGVRRVTIPAALVGMLRERRDVATGPLVFPTVLGNLRDPRNTARDWAHARERLEIPDYTFHSFRKTVATALDQAGLSARDIGEYLGHADPGLTMKTYMSKTVGGNRAATALDELINRK